METWLSTILLIALSVGLVVVFLGAYDLSLDIIASIREKRIDLAQSGKDGKSAGKNQKKEDRILEDEWW